MKHEVKIPSDCKATVSIEDRMILIMIDQKDDIPVAGHNCFKLSEEQIGKLGEMSHKMGLSGRHREGEYYPLPPWADSSNNGGMNSKESAPEGDIEAHCDLGEGESMGVLSLIKDGHIQSSINLDKLTGKESIDVPHIPAFAGKFVKSDAGYIAMTGEQNYAVVLTPAGEIQLNQSCNFPITIPAKFDDADKLMTELAKQKALMIVGNELVKWRPAILACEPLSAINAVWKAKTFLSMEDGLMDDLLLADNIFPPGFLTEEKISQFKKTIMDLFDSWRQ